MLQGILHRNLNNHRRQHQRHVNLLGNIKPGHRKQRIGFVAKRRIAHHHLQLILQAYCHLIAGKQIGSEHLYQKAQRLHVDTLWQIRDKDVEHVEHEVGREAIAHVLHLQRHHAVHLFPMLMLVAQRLIAIEHHQCQHAHHQQTNDQEQD